MPKISVIICTHNPRREYLDRVLNGLKTQTLPAGEWELLLIDNASKDQLCSQYDLSWHPNGRHVREDMVGLTAARLRGIQESKAELLVFVDDDTVLALDYLAQADDISNEFPFVGMWGGSCRPEFERPLPDWVGNQIWRLTIVEVKEDVWSNLREGFLTTPPGAGMCVRREVCRRFLERCRNGSGQTLGRRGSSLSGYEDAEMAQCAIDLGLGTGRFKRLSLTHLIPANRLTIEYFVKHAEGDAASLMVYRALRNLPVEKPRPMTLIGRVRWFIGRRIKKVSYEEFLIQKAHSRGLGKGYAMVEELLGKNRPGNPG